MKILSISIKSPEGFDGVNNFTIGHKVNDDELAPKVKSIVFYDRGAYSENKSGVSIFKAYKGPCYLLSFEDDDNKMIIPVCEIRSIVVNSEKKSKSESKAETKLAETEAENIPAE